MVLPVLLSAPASGGTDRDPWETDRKGIAPYRWKPATVSQRQALHDGRDGRGRSICDGVGEGPRIGTNRLSRSQTI